LIDDIVMIMIIDDKFILESCATSTFIVGSSFAPFTRTKLRLRPLANARSRHVQQEGASAAAAHADEVALAGHHAGAELGGERLRKRRGRGKSRGGREPGNL